MSDSIVPEKSCLRRSEQLEIDDKYDILQHVKVHRTIADLFTVRETPLNPKIMSYLSLEKESDYDSSLNMQNVKQDLTHVLMLQTDESQHETHCEIISTKAQSQNYHGDHLNKSNSDTSDSIIAGSQDLFGDSPSPPRDTYCCKLLTKMSRQESYCCTAVHESTPVSSSNRASLNPRKKLGLLKIPIRLASQKILEAFSFSSLDDNSVCVSSLSCSADLFSEDEIDNQCDRVLGTCDLSNNMVNTSNHINRVMSTNCHGNIVQDDHNQVNDIMDNVNNTDISDTSEESCIADSQDLFED
jgi:hypothetical protein